TVVLADDHDRQVLKHALERVAEDDQVDDRQQHAGEDGQRIAAELEQVAPHYRPRLSHRRASPQRPGGIGIPKLELKKPPLRAGSSRSRRPVKRMKTSSSDIRSSLIDETFAPAFSISPMIFGIACAPSSAKTTIGPSGSRVTSWTPGCPRSIATICSALPTTSSSMRSEPLTIALSSAGVPIAIILPPSTIAIRSHKVSA